MITTDDADCCCGEEGCDPYPKCVSYEHGPAASGGGLKKCGLMLPSTGGPDRVRASCHIRGRIPNYNGSGAATDIVRYWLHSATLPQITDWPRPMCPQWVQSAADGCLVLTEFTEKTTLAIVYRDGSSASVDVIAHAFTDGRRWKVTCTPDGNGEIYTGLGAGRTVTDTRVFTSLDFDGGTDYGYCEGTLSERSHSSRLVISGIDPAAFTDDAKYWVVVAVPPDTALPSQPDLTCRKPQSVECFNDPARTFPSVVKWSLVHTATFVNSIDEYSFGSGSGAFYLSKRLRYSGSASTTAYGRACNLGSCFGILIPSSNCAMTVENAAGERTYRLDATDTEILYREDGSVVDNFNRSGSSTGYINPANRCNGAAFPASLLDHMCSLGSALLLNRVPQPVGTASLFVGTGYFANGTTPMLNPPLTDPATAVGTYVDSDELDSWSTTLGQNFIECRRTYNRAFVPSSGGFNRVSYVSSLRLTIEPDPLACPPAGGIVGIPPRDAAIAMLDAYFRGKP